MKQESRARRVGLTVVLCALVLRLGSEGYGDKFLGWLTSPDTAAFFIYLETGRDVRFSPSLPAFSPDFMESPPASTLPPTEPTLPSFSDADGLELYYASTEDPDIPALLARPLQWNLRGEEPTVLIIHTHTTESYTRTDEPYTESAAWRTADEKYNMVSIGDTVSRILEENGIPVIHDRALHDYPYIDPALLNAQLPYVTYLTPFTYGITSSGGLLPLEDDALLAAARQHWTRPVMHLSTLTESGQFDTQRAQQVLTDEAVQDRLVEELFQTILRRGYAGLDVDFEYLPGDLASAYADFLSRLRRLLHPQGLFLWAALAPKTSARQRGLLYEGHDYAGISAAADAVLLMTYEWGYTYGPPMAVAPLPNVRAVLDYAVTEMPPEKILLGVPNYGYDWPLPFVQGVTRAQSISNQRAIELAVEHRIAIQYDETAQSPFFHYTDANGTVHEVWFEDARSMDAKLRLIAEYGFLGAGFWNLMRPFSQTWLVLDSLYDIQ